MMRRAVSLTLCTVACIAVGYTLADAVDHAADAVACQTEDAHNCYWDAARRGNGRGTSFIDVAGHTYYLPR